MIIYRDSVGVAVSAIDDEALEVLTVSIGANASY
jgi:hypothetical protein